MSSVADNPGNDHVPHGDDSCCIEPQQSETKRSWRRRSALLVGRSGAWSGLKGFENHRVGHLAEAVRTLRKTPFTAVVVDLDLPDSSGLSTCQRLLQASGRAAVVVLIDDAQVRDLASRVLSLGADAYLPLGKADPVVVESVVRTALAHRAANESQRQVADRFGLAFQGAGDGLWDWDCQSEMAFFSRRCNEMFGYEEGDGHFNIGRWFSRVHPDDLPTLQARLETLVDQGGGRFNFEHRTLNGSGEPHWLQVRGIAAHDLEGRALRLVGLFADVTDRRIEEERAVHRSLHDDLTGLANRGLFVDRVARSLGALQRQDDRRLAVLFIDLDEFKAVNDLYGHRAGDRALETIARRLESVIRFGDTVARLGGDEFGILLPSLDEVGHAMHVADRAQEVLAEPIQVDRNDIMVGASIGIALSRKGSVEPSAIIHDADVAMYRAKALGGGRCQVCDPSMHDDAVALLRLETELRQAVACRQFQMFFQPIVDLHSGRVSGLEGNLRWNHPQRGLISPADFLAVAEATGLMPDLGTWVVKECCRQLGEWRRRLDSQLTLWLCVNVCAGLMRNRDLVKELAIMLELSGVPPQRIVLEFTEDAVLDNGSNVQDQLLRLHDLGVRLGIDDFGTGYSSLSHLDRFEYDILKIDPSIVQQLDESDAGDRLISTVLGLAGQLGIEVIAEGVETSTQAARLKRLGCRYAQGFWLAEPAPPETVEQLIEAPPEWWKLGQE